MKKLKLKKNVKKTLYGLIKVAVIIIVIVFICEFIEFKVLSNRTLTPKEIYEKGYYTLSDFGYVRLVSDTDYNLNGNDDYTDYLIGLKSFAERNPKYVSNYYAGGYPPLDEGVCTDTIVEAIDAAGYNLKDMISFDIKNTYKDNIYNIEIIDSNIDYRRVGNQQTFFERYLEELDTDYNNIEEFQPGDILIFDYGDHIAMVSDKVNEKGIPYLIQNRDETQEEKEEDRLEITDMKVTRHYRFTYNEKIKELIMNMNKTK